MEEKETMSNFKWFLFTVFMLAPFINLGVFIFMLFFKEGGDLKARLIKNGLILILASYTMLSFYFTLSQPYFFG